jgi:hypothetical protein
MPMGRHSIASPVMNRSTYIRSFTILGVLLWSAVASAGISDAEAKRFYQSVKPPRTVPELLQAVRAIVESGVYSRDDFYTENNLKRLFGEQPRVGISDDGIVTSAYIHGFAGLVSGPDESTKIMDYLTGVWFEARRPDVANSWDGDICCRMSVEFWGIIKGLDFLSVTSVLGPDWKENRKAEASRIREFLTAPLPPVTGYMGDSIIGYKAGKATMSLEFDFDGRLHQIYSDWPKSQ